MPDVDEQGSTHNPFFSKKSKNFHSNVPQENSGFFLKGSAHLDWGMKNRLSRIFNPKSGRTIMLAFDHGYFQGPTTGLERVDINIMPLEPYVDCLMLTRGMARSVVPPITQKPLAVRASGGTSMVKEDLSDEDIAMSIEDAIRLNASALAIQVFIGGEHQRASIINMTKLVDEGNRAGIPVMAVTAVGKEMARTPQYFRLATRICAELGAHFIKTYYTPEEFDTITSCCPVPIVIAGGKKIPELDALKMAHNAVQQGASGVDMGRNIFQSDSPICMVKAVQKVVHENASPEEAYEYYCTTRDEEKEAKGGE